MSIIKDKFYNPDIKNIGEDTLTFSNIPPEYIDDYIDFKTGQVGNILKNSNEEVKNYGEEEKEALEKSIFEYGEFILNLKNNTRSNLESDLDYNEKLEKNNIGEILGKILNNIRKTLNYDNIYFELSKKSLDELLEKIETTLIKNNKNSKISDLVQIVNKDVLDNLYNFLYIYKKELTNISLNTNDIIDIFYDSENIEISILEDEVGKIIFPKDYNQFLLDSSEGGEYDINYEKSENNTLKNLINPKSSKEEEFQERVQKLLQIQKDIESGKIEVYEQQKDIDQNYLERRGNPYIRTENKAARERYYEIKTSAEKLKKIKLIDKEIKEIKQKLINLKKSEVN